MAEPQAAAATTAVALPGRPRALTMAPAEALPEPHPRFPDIPECSMPVASTPLPCVRTSCRYHLAHRSAWEHQLDPTRDCALAVAVEGPHTMDEVADILGISKECVRQAEASAIAKLERRSELKRAYDELDGVPLPAPEELGPDHSPRRSMSPAGLRRATLAIGRQLAAERDEPLRIAFADTLAGDLARVEAHRRLRQLLPRFGTQRIERLIREHLTP